MTLQGCRFVFRRDTYGKIVGGRGHCGGDGGGEYHFKVVC